MGLGLAIKAFFKALKNSKEAEEFLGDKKEEKVKIKEADTSHLRLLHMLQNSGRFIDFLKEDIVPFSDAQVGAVVRSIHEECGKSLENFVTIRPIFEEKEGDMITVAEGFDPSEVKIVGNVKGNPPYNGVLRHKYKREDR
jgi:hypothetical protein